MIDENENFDNSKSKSENVKENENENEKEDKTNIPNSNIPTDNFYTKIPYNPLSTYNTSNTISNPTQKLSFGIDSENQRFPYCIVWTPLPLISWFIPIIGHTGICS